MISTEQILEFDKIKEIWKEQALTDWAKEEIENTSLCYSETQLLSKQRETTEAKFLLEMCKMPPLVSMIGIEELVSLACKGACLTAVQLEEIDIFLVAVRRMKDYLKRCKQYEVSLPYIGDSLDDLEMIREGIHMQIRNGKVDDGASKLLRSLRNEIAYTETKMREKADSVIRSNKECMSDQFSTIRNGRICVPVKKEYKFKISGSVIDKSSSGSTLFIEPTAVAKFYEELQILYIEEENEERRILYELTSMVAEEEGAITEDRKRIQILDFIFSKGKLSLIYDGIEPQIRMDRKIYLKEVRHPLMDKKICVPIDFEIGETIRGIVITGPNTGGKTVALKTVALNCMMAQCGLHVSAKQAEVCMNSNYLCDIGDGQSLSENLSTFSAHIVNVLDILRKVTRSSLVIMDELGSGTDPAEGMALAIAILEELKKSEALFLVTTHYPDVKQYAEKEPSIQNARMTFDKESLKPLYQLVIGEAGESCAFYIAGKLGMPAHMLQYASKIAYGEESKKYFQDFEQMTGTIEKQSSAKIQKKKDTTQIRKNIEKYHLGDSVIVYPDKKIGIVCQPVNEKGILQVQLPNKKIWINHKRVKLHVAAEQLYPEDYDFSIIFDTVENRKLRHQMERKFVEGAEIILSEE